MIRFFFSLVLTIFIAPGVGHLLYKKYKKFVILLLIYLGVCFAEAVVLVKFVDINSLTSFDWLDKLRMINEIMLNHNQEIKYYEIARMAILAYALADIIWNRFKNNVKVIKISK